VHSIVHLIVISQTRTRVYIVHRNKNCSINSFTST